MSRPDHKLSTEPVCETLVSGGGTDVLLRSRTITRSLRCRNRVIWKRDLHRQARDRREGNARDGAGERRCRAEQSDEGERHADQDAQGGGAILAVLVGQALDADTGIGGAADARFFVDFVKCLLETELSVGECATSTWRLLWLVVGLRRM